MAHCQLCTRADGLELCFSPEIAAQLRCGLHDGFSARSGGVVPHAVVDRRLVPAPQPPSCSTNRSRRSPYVFTCAAPPASAPEEPASDHSSAAAAGVPVDCKALSLEQCKLQQDSCAICISPLQPAGLCYPPATAKDLPGSEWGVALTWLVPVCLLSRPPGRLSPIALPSLPTQSSSSVPCPAPRPEHGELATRAQTEPSQIVACPSPLLALGAILSETRAGHARVDCKQVSRSVREAEHTGSAAPRVGSVSQVACCRRARLSCWARGRTAWQRAAARPRNRRGLRSCRCPPLRRGQSGGAGTTREARRRRRTSAACRLRGVWQGAGGRAVGAGQGRAAGTAAGRAGQRRQQRQPS